MFRKAQRIFERPDLIGRIIERQWYTRLGRHQMNPKGTSIFELDWDNLIILDACRYDIFDEQIKEISINGELSSRTTLASATREYVSANFSGRNLTDTVCLSVNGWYRKKLPYLNTEVHDLIDIESMDLPAESYDSDFKIPLPEVVTNKAIDATTKYPNKRLIIHHNQPHYPYLGEVGRSMFTAATSSLQDAVKACAATPDAVERAYRENLRLALDEVRALIPNLEGKTVITADHGEMLGERYNFPPVRNYGHPVGVYKKELTQVPWFVIDTGERKDITKGDPKCNLQTEVTEKTEENLRALGYS